MTIAEVGTRQSKVLLPVNQNTMPFRSCAQGLPFIYTTLENGVIYL